MFTIQVNEHTQQKYDFIKLLNLTIVQLRGEFCLSICYVNLIENAWNLKLSKKGVHCVLL